jgi:hypothetical protein
MDKAESVPAEEGDQVIAVSHDSWGLSLNAAHRALGSGLWALGSGKKNSAVLRSLLYLASAQQQPARVT